MKTITYLIVCLSTFISIVFAGNSVPPLINYQGQLMDAEGTGLEGIRKLEFNIYDSVEPTATPVWGPQVFNNVPLLNGRFNVILGATDMDGDSILTAFSTNQRFLGIKVTDAGGDLSSAQEIKPRQKMLSAPFAIKSGHHSNIIPIGSIQAFLGTTVPMGWLLCDGKTIGNSASAAIHKGEHLKALFEIVKTISPNLGTEVFNDAATVTMPDMRGLFLRGLDTSGSIDPEGATRSIGSNQADAVGPHNHFFPNAYPNIAIDGGTPYGSLLWDQDRSVTPQPDWVDDDKFINGSIKKENRPKNIAVNYIIKY